MRRGDSIKIDDYIAGFQNQTEAAKALGLRSRQTFHDWRKAGHETIPHPWGVVASLVLKERNEDSGNRQP